MQSKNLMLIFLTVAVALSGLSLGAFGQTGPRKQSELKKPTHRVAVTLKNGQVVNGYFIQANEESLEIDSKDGHQQIKLSEIASISFTDSSQTTGGWQPPPKEIIQGLENAVKALRKMEGAAAVKVSLKEYESRMIDTKVDVEEILSKLPDGDLKSEMKRALDAYVDAQSIWEEEIDYEIVMPSKSPLAAEFMKKYSIPPIEKTADPDKIRLDRDQMIDVIWRAAASHVEKLPPLVSSFIFDR